MSRIGTLYHSVIGKKAIVATTGSLMIGFLILHVWGNLKVFASPTLAGEPEVDVYADFLRTMGEPILPLGFALWVIRIVMLVSLFLHVVCVVQLAQHNRKARPVRYRHARKYEEATVPARVMLYTGSIILVFIGFHLLQFTIGDIDTSRFTQNAVYGDLYRAFQLPGYVALYVSVMAIIGVHLYHGIWSLFQTVGADNPDRNKGLRGFAVGLALVLFLAFSSVPVSFFAGVLSKPPSQFAQTPSSDSR
ncbi:MAG: succinate dehydrogenase cytochrome b subunit [Myxococcota bacterium]